MEPPVAVSSSGPTSVSLSWPIIKWGVQHLYRANHFQSAAARDAFAAAVDQLACDSVATTTAVLDELNDVVHGATASAAVGRVDGTVYTFKCAPVNLA